MHTRPVRTVIRATGIRTKWIDLENGNNIIAHCSATTAERYNGQLWFLPPSTAKRCMYRSRRQGIIFQISAFSRTRNTTNTDTTINTNNNNKNNTHLYMIMYSVRTKKTRAKLDYRETMRPSRVGFSCAREQAGSRNRRRPKTLHPSSVVFCVPYIITYKRRRLRNYLPPERHARATGGRRAVRTPH